MSAIDFARMRAQMRAEAKAARQAEQQQASGPEPGAVAAEPLEPRQRCGEHNRVGEVERVYYIADFVSEAGASELQAHLPAPADPAWTQLTNRKLLNCGGVPHPSGMFAEALPPWFSGVSERLLASGAFPADAPPRPGPTVGLRPRPTMMLRRRC